MALQGIDIVFPFEVYQPIYLFEGVLISLKSIRGIN